MKAYEEMTPDEKLQFRAGAYESAIKDAWYTLTHIHEYEQQHVGTHNEIIQGVIARLKSVLEFDK